MKLYTIALQIIFSSVLCFGEEVQPLSQWMEGEYRKQYREALSNGSLDPSDKIIPKRIRSNKRALLFYRGGYVRGVLTRVELFRNKRYRDDEDAVLGFHSNLNAGMEYYEYEGYLAGCLAAHNFREKLLLKLEVAVNKKLDEAKLQKKAEQGEASDR